MATKSFCFGAFPARRRLPRLAADVAAISADSTVDGAGTGVNLRLELTGRLTASSR
ncbi:MAG: hypothetical protein INH41_20585 [Myxococcaceae bacterium]|nr:hypothetical protein [Myxococcaceae bacterium]MCA3014788.1 hypothetical protein [Myxococcaceae bacterium]